MLLRPLAVLLFLDDGLGFEIETRRKAKLRSAPTGQSFTVILRTTRSLITSHLFPFAHGYVSSVLILPTSLSDAAVLSRHRELNTLQFGSRQFRKFRWLKANHFDLGQGALWPLGGSNRLRPFKSYGFYSLPCHFAPVCVTHSTAHPTAVLIILVFLWWHRPHNYNLNGWLGRKTPSYLWWQCSIRNPPPPPVPSQAIHGSLVPAGIPATTTTSLITEIFRSSNGLHRFRSFWIIAYRQVYTCMFFLPSLLTDWLINWFYTVDWFSYHNLIYIRFSSPPPPPHSPVGESQKRKTWVFASQGDQDSSGVVIAHTATETIKGSVFPLVWTTLQHVCSARQLHYTSVTLNKRWPRCSRCLETAL